MSSSVITTRAPAAPPVGRPAPGPPARPRSRSIRLVPRRIRHRSGLVRLISPVGILVLWQLASATGVLPARRLAAPTVILHTGWQLINDGTLPRALEISLQRVAVGVLAGSTIGIALGLVAGLSR